MYLVHIRVCCKQIRGGSGGEWPCTRRLNKRAVTNCSREQFTIQWVIIYGPCRRSFLSRDLPIFVPTETTDYFLQAGQ